MGTLAGWSWSCWDYYCFAIGVGFYFEGRGARMNAADIRRTKCGGGLETALVVGSRLNQHSEEGTKAREKAHTSITADWIASFDLLLAVAQATTLQFGSLVFLFIPWDLEVEVDVDLNLDWQRYHLKVLQRPSGIIC